MGHFSWVSILNFDSKKIACMLTLVFSAVKVSSDACFVLLLIDSTTKNGKESYGINLEYNLSLVLVG